MNESVKNLPLSLVFLGDEVRLDNAALREDLDKSNYLVGFENIGRNKAELVSFKKDYKERVFWANTRYHSKIGAIVRIVSFLCSLNPDQIAIIGMDGFKSAEITKPENAHAFEPHKMPNGSYENNFKGNLIEQKYKQQYLEFWDYVLHDIGKEIKFENLSDGHPCNLTTEILTNKLGKNYQDYLFDIRMRK
jgi:pullulanase/glycogen debranching enzyme